MSDARSPMRLEPAVFRLLKLLRYLREINLSSEETLALLRRLETDSCRPADYEVLIRVVRAHTKLSADDLEAFLGLDGPSLARRRSPQEPGSKKRRRRLRASGRGLGARGGSGSLPVAPSDGQRGSHRAHEMGDVP
jgi:hypothetical protein